MAANSKRNKLTAVTDADVSEVEQAFRRFDRNHTGVLMLGDLLDAGELVGGIQFPVSRFREADRGLRGYITLLEFARGVFPQVPSRDIARHFGTYLPAEEVRLLHRTFMDITDESGTLTATHVAQCGEKLAGLRFTADMYQRMPKQSPKFVTFLELLRYLFPKIHPDLIRRYTETVMSVKDVATLKPEFDKLDTDKSGQLSFDEIKGRSIQIGGMQLDKEQFQAMDLDQSGHVSFLELLEAMYPLISKWELQYVLNEYMANQDASNPEALRITTKARKQPPRNATRFTDTEFLYLHDIFSQLDKDGSGELSFKELSADPTLARIGFDLQMFRKIDKDRSGRVSIPEIVEFLYPNVPRRDIQRYFATELSYDMFHIIKKAFHDATKGTDRLTLAQIETLGGKIAGMTLTPKAFKKLRSPQGITFLQFLAVLFPNVPQPLLHRYTATSIPRSEFLQLRADFQALDRDGSGTLSLQEFNRSRQTSPRTGDMPTHADFLRSAGSGSSKTLGGMKFDVKVFNSIDRNKSGTITFAELLQAFYPNLPQPHLQFYIKLYSYLDQSKQHLRELVVQEGEARELMYKEEAYEYSKFWAEYATLPKPEIPRTLAALRWDLEAHERRHRTRLEVTQEKDFQLITERFSSNPRGRAVILARIVHGEALLEAHYKMEALFEEQARARISLRLDAEKSLKELMGLFGTATQAVEKTDRERTRIWHLLRDCLSMEKAQRFVLYASEREERKVYQLHRLQRQEMLRRWRLGNSFREELAVAVEISELWQRQIERRARIAYEELEERIALADREGIKFAQLRRKYTPVMTKAALTCAAPCEATCFCAFDCWIRWAQAPNDANRQRLCLFRLAHSGVGNTNIAFAMYAQPETFTAPATLFTYVMDRNGRELEAYTEIVRLADGEWHHLLWKVQSPADNEIELWLDSEKCNLRLLRCASPQSFAPLDDVACWGGAGVSGSVRFQIPGSFRNLRLYDIGAAQSSGDKSARAAPNPATATSPRVQLSVVPPADNAPVAPEDDPRVVPPQYTVSLRMSLPEPRLLSLRLLPVSLE
eukprot:TRINITY_DN10685_c0_g1_i1.p1 TRINITY_DN10685_c0_g1~~TRINITY_DN10685_c0_g1_i1.p1  ORF type:complete len:1053 (+),score=158.91 TRINITY_DN10685_c0_g1_i1:47-3205(+)